MKFVFLLSVFFFFISCFLMPPSSNNQSSDKICYEEYIYDREHGAWVDDQGQVQPCSIYDNKNIFPTVNGSCDLWNENFGLNNEEKSQSEDDESFTGEFKIEFQRVFINGQLACIKQEYYEYEGGVIPLGRTKYCLISDKDGFQIEECS